MSPVAINSTIAPRDLCVTTMECVQAKMLEPGLLQGETPMACSLFLEDIGDTIPFYPDFTFKGQMQQVYERPEAIDSQLTTPPDLYLLTANSAIPVADSIRGRYEALGMDCPDLGYISANRNAAVRFRQGDLREVITEAARLVSHVEGRMHICVIDQFVATGNTLRYAAVLLRHAGVVAASAIRGNWYDDCPSKEVSKEQLTSAHAPAMRKIGRLSVV